MPDKQDVIPKDVFGMDAFELLLPLAAALFHAERTSLVNAADLRQAREHPRRHQEAFMRIGQAVTRAQRLWEATKEAARAHFAFEEIDQLGQRIDSLLSELMRGKSPEIVQSHETYRQADEFEKHLKARQGLHAPRAAASEPGIIDGHRAAGVATPNPNEKRTDDPAAPSVDDAAFLTVRKLAEMFDVSAEALRKRLERWRGTNHGGWMEDEEAASRAARFLYRYGAVKHIIEELRASGERPAKKN